MTASRSPRAHGTRRETRARPRPLHLQCSSKHALDVQSQPNPVLSCLETVSFAPVLNATTSGARQSWRPNPWNGPIVLQEPVFAGWKYRKSSHVSSSVRIPVYTTAGLHLSKPARSVLLRIAAPSKIVAVRRSFDSACLCRSKSNFMPSIGCCEPGKFIAG